MKSDLVGPKKEKQQKPEYPYLGILRKKEAYDRVGLVVLFVEENKGAVVHEAKKIYGEGRYISDWAEGAFTPLEGKIILENE